MLKKTLQCLEGIHLSQSGALLMLYVDKLLSTPFRVLARMVDTLACRRVEMLLAETLQVTHTHTHAWYHTQQFKWYFYTLEPGSKFHARKFINIFPNVCLAQQKSKKLIVIGYIFQGKSSQNLIYPHVVQVCLFFFFFFCEQQVFHRIWHLAYFHTWYWNQVQARYAARQPQSEQALS